MFNGLLENFAASVVLLTAGWSFNYLKRRLMLVRPVKKLWGIADPDRLIICTATSAYTDAGEYTRPATGLGQVRALGYAVESLGKAYDVHIENVLFSMEELQDRLERDIIVLGGPKNNRITRKFLDKLTPMQIADQVGGVIFWKVAGEEGEFRPATDGNRKVTMDYGLIIRCANPFADESRPTSFCLFSGCHTYGTIAAARYFTENYIRECRGWHFPSGNIAMVVACEVCDSFPTSIKCVRKHEF